MFLTVHERQACICRLIISISSRRGWKIEKLSVSSRLHIVCVDLGLSNWLIWRHMQTHYENTIQTETKNQIKIKCIAVCNGVRRKSCHIQNEINSNKMLNGSVDGLLAGGGRLHSLLRSFIHDHTRRTPFQQLAACNERAISITTQQNSTKWNWAHGSAILKLN